MTLDESLSKLGDIMNKTLNQKHMEKYEKGVPLELEWRRELYCQVKKNAFC